MDKFHIMIDLETMSSNSNAAIVSLGACKFSVANGIEDKFYYTCSLESSMDYNLHVDGNTVMWWMKQSDKARAALDEYGDLSDLLHEFSEWMNWPGEPVIWGNGAAFDNVVLSNAYKAVGYEKPWSFRNDMCYRTLKNIVDVPYPLQVGEKHNALDDAINQANHLIEIFKKLGIQ